MKQTLLSLLILICLSCNDSGKQYVEVPYETIINGIPIDFPGKMLIDSDYIYLDTPTATDFNVRVYDIQTGEEVTRLLRKGRGPNEFLATTSQQVSEKALYFLSINPNEEAKTTINPLPAPGECEITSLSGENTDFLTAALYISDTSRIVLQPGMRNILKYSTNSNNFEFGDIFSVDTVENGWDILQGRIDYNPNRSILVYTATRIPYIGIYGYNSNREVFYLIKEIKDTRQYKIDKKRLVINNKQRGCGGLSLTKDYILTIQRDYDLDNIDENTVGRDFSKAARTLFVYSYQGDLKSIIDLEYPVIRIASTYHDNTVYAIIYQDKEFKIIKLKI